MIKFAEKSYFMNFFVSLIFDSSEQPFLAFFGRFSGCDSKMYLGHLYMSQSMLGKQIWKYSLALLQLLDSTIKWPSGGLYGLVI